MAKSDTNDINQMKINAGDGNNTIGFSGAANTKVVVTSGAGVDAITVSGQTGATVNAGGGNDTITLAGATSGYGRMRAPATIASSSARREA